MNAKFKERMHRKLLKLKTEVLQTLIAENDGFRAAVEDIGVKDLADVASNDVDARTLEAVGTKDKMRLQSIEAALFRIQGDRYGICGGCKSKISNARLDAIPYAVLCVNCQSSAEKRRKNR